MTRTLFRPWTAILAAFVLLLTGVDDCDRAKLDAIAPDGQVHPDFRAPAAGSPSVDYRNIDGTGNHQTHFELGASHTPLRRTFAAAYGDGVSSMAGGDRPSAREISNAVCNQDQPRPDPSGASDFLWQWGQFLDHDIDLTEANAPFGPAHIRPVTGDPFFDPDSGGVSQIDFFRSQGVRGTGIGSAYPRQQVNSITHYIDASNVYGSDDVRAAALRTNDGTGRLAVSAGNMLPFNTGGFDNAGGTGPELFLAGDIRANEQVGLTAMHTLFVREHNRLAAEISSTTPGLSGEEIYQRARRFVGALMQGITYNEFLPALLGPDALPAYRGYRSTVTPAISNSFSTAAYRFGHSAVNETILRLDANGQAIAFGHLPLKDAFFAPQRLTQEGGIEPILRGLAAQEMSAVDSQVVDALRNFLFGDPAAGGLDLAALNIQRGRDHGLPGYALAQPYVGTVDSFEDIGVDPVMHSLLASLYDSVDDVDMWVGGIVEEPISGGHLGTLFFRVIANQFIRLRDGDRYWYEWNLSAAEIVDIDSTTLADVIRRNTTIGAEISDDVFQAN